MPHATECRSLVFICFEKLQTRDASGFRSSFERVWRTAILRWQTSSSMAGGKTSTSVLSASLENSEVAAAMCARRVHCGAAKIEVSVRSRVAGETPSNNQSSQMRISLWYHKQGLSSYNRESGPSCSAAAWSLVPVRSPCKHLGYPHGEPLGNLVVERVMVGWKVMVGFVLT